MSIISFADRGPWGDSRYRGNCSGHVYKWLYEQLDVQSVIDPCKGSGSSEGPAKEMGIRYVGLDLRDGFNLLRDDIAAAAGFLADLVVSHPPYHDMILYSGNMWGNPHPDDLSRCQTVEDFCQKVQVMLFNQRNATRPGGHYATIIGDQRKKGTYVSYQAEMIARMPRDELKAVIIKAQHNCVSSGRTYARMRYPHILHEYLLIWQRPDRTISWLGTLCDVACHQRDRLQGTWRSVVQHALTTLGGRASLAELYDVIAENAPERLAVNEHWKDKVRQTLQTCGVFAPVERGVWQVAA